MAADVTGAARSAPVVAVPASPPTTVGVDADDPAAAAALVELWRASALPAEALADVALRGRDPVLASSFRIGAAAAATTAAAALAACGFGRLRGGPRRRVEVDAAHAALECTSWFSIDGVEPEMWEKFSGLYRCGDGHVRIHANFAHHRDAALGRLGLDAAGAGRADVERALARWRAIDFETAVFDAGGVATAMRSFDAWDVTPQARAVAAEPLLAFERLDDAPARPAATVDADAPPLAGVRVVDLTRILAGPVGTRALADAGADVMLVSAPHLPNIAAVAETSRGKRSALADLRTAAGHGALAALVRGADVVVQGYRPGALAARGFGPPDLAATSPGIVAVTLSAWGRGGPWAARRGFDSLVQTAAGFNDAEGRAFAASRGGEPDGPPAPRALPVQILDHAAGRLIALGAAAALWRQRREGGSWHVHVSLARTAAWLRGLGRVSCGFDAVAPERAPFVERAASGWGEIASIAPAARIEGVGRSARPSMPPGSHPPTWDVG